MRFSPRAATLLGLKPNSEMRAAIADTRLTAATRSARTSRARLKEAIDSMSDGFAMWDADDRLIAWNSTYAVFYADTTLTQGMQFEDLVRYTATHGLVSVPEHEIDHWIQSRLRMFHQEQHNLLQAADGRWHGEATHWGTYLEIDRPRKLVFTWFTTAEAERESTSVVTLTIRRDGDGCVATIVHELDAKWADAVKKCQQGWHGMLVQIDTFLCSEH